MSKEFKSFFKTVGGGEGAKCHYPTRLDTYGCGCSHDCSYCYAKSLLSFRKLWNPTDPSVADIKKIERVIKKIPAGSIVRLGGMTDCLQPAEAIHNIAYQTIQLLNKYKIGYLIVTKSAMIAEDKYINVLDKDLAHVQITVTTTDDELSKTYEKASLPSARIQAIKKLQDKGIDVAIRLSPYIPEYIDTNIVNGVCDKAIVEFLRVNSWIQKWFNLDYLEYTLKEGNYKHLTLDKKQEYISRLKFNEISVCEDVNEHFEFWKNNYNPNPEDCCNLRKK